VAALPAVRQEDKAAWYECATMMSTPGVQFEQQASVLASIHKMRLLHSTFAANNRRQDGIGEVQGLPAVHI